MKRLLLLLLLISSVSCPVYAQSTTDKEKKPMFDKIVDIGSKVLKKRDERKQQRQASERDESTGAETQLTATPRVSASELAIEIADELLGGKVSSMKDHIKAEGKGYARQFGDVVAQRILADPRVNAALQMIKMLAWGLVAYLTVVTLALLKGLSSIKKSNARILALLDEQKKRGTQH